MQRITFRHVMPDGEHITSTFLMMSEREWSKRPEAKSPGWASTSVDGTVFALALTGSGGLSLGPKTERDAAVLSN